MKLTRFGAVILMAYSLILVGCTPTTASATKTIPTVEPGKAVVVGRIVSEQDDKPYADIVVRLAEVYYNDKNEGAYALDAAYSPGATTDKDGYFVFTNITARKYVFVVGDPLTSYMIYTDTDGKAKVWDAAPDKVLDMGTLKIKFNP